LLFVLLGFVSLDPASFYYYWMITMESVAALLVLPKLSSLRTGKGLVFRTVTFVSVISYSIYLLNYTPFMEFVLPYFDHHPLTGIAMFFIWSFAGAYLLYRFVEQPMMKLREKFTYAEPAVISRGDTVTVKPQPEMMKEF
jgi:peptidoglycan/LPS O-acetylase OafA/YrhL